MGGDPGREADRDRRGKNAERPPLKCTRQGGGRRKTKGARDGKRLSFGRRNPAYAKLIVEIDQADQVGLDAYRGEVDLVLKEVDETDLPF